MERIFDLNEVAKWAQVEASTVRKWSERDEILVTKFGNRSFLTASELSLCLWAKNPVRAQEFDHTYGVVYGEN